MCEWGGESARVYVSRAVSRMARVYVSGEVSRTAMVYVSGEVSWTERVYVSGSDKEGAYERGDVGRRGLEEGDKHYPLVCRYVYTRW